MDYDGDLLYSSDLLWDDIPRSDSVLGGDSIWPLAASHDGEEDIATQSLLHSHDPLLTSTMVTAGDEAEQVNDLLFDELERITISNPSPSPQLDLGIVSSFYYLHTTCWLLFYFFTFRPRESINDNLTPHLNAHSLPFNAFLSLSLLL